MFFVLKNIKVQSQVMTCNSKNVYPEMRKATSTALQILHEHTQQAAQSRHNELQRNKKSFF